MKRSLQERLAKLRQGPGVAFLASQVGTHSSLRWNQAVEKLGVGSREAMLLWNLVLREGQSQRELATALNRPPSRLVEMVDALTAQGLVERRVRPDDRRARELHLTAKGRRLVERVLALGDVHEEEFTASLSEREQAQLAALLTKVAAAQGLIGTAHPNF